MDGLFKSGKHPKKQQTLISLCLTKQWRFDFGNWRGNLGFKNLFEKNVFNFRFKIIETRYLRAMQVEDVGSSKTCRYLPRTNFTQSQRILDLLNRQFLKELLFYVYCVSSKSSTSQPLSQPKLSHLNKSFFHWPKSF